MRNGSLGFREKVGFDYTPSRVNEMNRNLQPQNDVSESVDSWKVPRNESTQVIQLVNALKTKTASELLQFCVDELGVATKEPPQRFWSVYFEAAIRVSQDPVGLARALDDELDKIKLPRKRLLKHKLFSKIFLLKLSIISECTSDKKLISYLNSLSGTDHILTGLQDIYNKLSKQEFHSTGKDQSGNLMSFMLQQFLPFAVRDIPFAILRKVAMLCFDIELFEDDYSKFWDADINGEYQNFRSESSLHKWNDQTMMKSSSQVFGAVDEPQDSPQEYGVITLAYEAPWIMPNLQQPGGSARGPSRKSSTVTHPTARMVKLEGRRQSYKPDLSTSSTNLEDGNGAICLVASNDDDGWHSTANDFSIRRNSLDEIPGDWDSVSGIGNEQKKHGLNDVLEDLLSSPTRPSTQTTNSPNNPRSRKRSLSQSPRKRLWDEDSSKSPQTVIKKPCKRESNEENVQPKSQNLREFLWNDEPPISERTRKGATPKETRNKYNI